MSRFDIDGIEVVETLEDICWDRRVLDGRLSERHFGAHVVETTGAWATVLIAVRDIRRDRPCPVRYVLTRYRKEAGGWRLTNHFRLPERTLTALAASAIPFITECDKDDDPCGSSSSAAS